MFFVVLGNHVSALTSLHGCHSNIGELCMNVDDVYFDESEIFFDVRVKRPLCSHLPFNLSFGHSVVF